MGRHMIRLILLAALVAAPAAAELHYVIIQGLGGEPSYAERFAEEVDRIAEGAKQSATSPDNVHVLRGETARREAIADTFTRLADELTEEDQLAVILIGHGSYDAQAYKLAIPGPDFTDRRLAEWLDAIPAQRQLVVNTTSSSGASMETLQREGRVVVTATKSGRERTATFFSKYWAAAFEDPEADVDKNETVTAQEAFDFADAKVQEFFESGKLLASEHARIEGEMAESFTLARLGSAAEALSDPALRPLLAEKEGIETKIAQLKLKKDAMSETEYFVELQELLIELAQVQERIATQTSSTPAAETPTADSPARSVP